MAIMDKIFFWRHKEPDFPKEELGLGKPEMDLGKEQLGLPEEEPIGAGIAPSGAFPGAPPTPPEAPAAPAIHTPPGMPQPGTPPGMPPVGKDIEIISAKLDALKAVLDSINQRLTNLERIAKEGNEVY